MKDDFNLDDADSDYYPLTKMAKTTWQWTDDVNHPGLDAHLLR